MSLAFDKTGKPFSFGPRTRKLLVRLFRNPGGRGTCCAVLDSDGQRVYLDAGADYPELRRAVGNVPGLYRLDQCDEDGVEIDNAPPAYVSIESLRNAAPAGDFDPRDAIIRELAQTNADIAKAAIAQNTSMMEAAAQILRAYIPNPPPPPPPPPPPSGEEDAEDDEEDEDEDEDDDLAEQVPPSAWAELVKELTPLLASLGAMASQRVLELVREHFQPRSPPPAAAPGPVADAPPSATPTAGAAAGPSPSPPPSSKDPVTAPHDVTTPTSAETTPTPRNASIVPTPEQLARLYTIRSKLTPREAKIAETAIARMQPEVLAQWLVDLAPLSLEEAVRVVRGVIAGTQPSHEQPPNPREGA